MGGFEGMTDANGMFAVPVQGAVEDLIFYFKVDWRIASTITIATPVGINILINLGTDGRFAGVYHMYVDYQGSFRIEGAVPFTAQDFNNIARRRFCINGFLNHLSADCSTPTSGTH